MDYINLMTCILTKAMVPVMSEYIFKMYNNPLDYIDSEKPGTIPTPSLINFQHALKRVQNLSSAQVQNFVNDIEKKCPSFSKYKDSIYVAYVKLVSNAVKVKAESKKINIKPPSNEMFVHQCLILCAHNFYENPYIMKEHDELKKDKEVQERVKFCISEAISDSIPFCDILGEYLNTDFTSDETAVENLMNPSGEEAPEETTASDIPGPTSPITESPFEIAKKEEESEEPDLFPDAPTTHPKPEEKKTLNI